MATGHIMLVGYILLFYTFNAAADAASEDFFNHVLSELSSLKVKVSECEEGLSKLHVKVSTNKFKAAEIYERRFAEMEDRLFTVERKLKTTEEFYKTNIAEMENLLLATKNKFKAFENCDHAINTMSTLAVNTDRVELAKPEVNTSASKDELKNTENAFSKLEYESHSNETSIQQVKNLFKSDKMDPIKREESKLPLLKRLLCPAVSDRVAFTAYLSDHASGLGRDHTIPFDKVLLNEGQAFDTVLHVFICPVNGTYVFQSALMSSHTEHIQTEIVKDNNALVRMYAAGATGSHGFDQGFNSAIVQCYKGERVWVRVRNRYGTEVFSALFSSFSGYILWNI
ncbi:uncharacterized protein LOC123524627 [Mercenaria mercenaria]|uniref:uncharacterized protein LOC123524627 n=1 Tax=Mercenaria mercenaria TaxID=6596 RepID=UPI00234E3916|nr:uncharacterized protein LOC123524627 [Mercenaria mercenaria]